MLPVFAGLSPNVFSSGNGGIFMSENTPKRIGDYEVIRQLGHGGMGEVYLVRNVLSDRTEAMKVLLPSLAGRSEFVARFMREIKVLASLEHPNIAALRTAFTADDQFVMIMEYVEGTTLAERLEKGPFSTSDALNYIDQVLAALSYAHGKHVIHRDIKPGNMMLTPQGVVKLMDFGLARSADEVGLTMTGTTLGSLDYASPEQVQSQPTDERSDLYSVGVSLYQMVTGQRMFSVTSSFSIMEAQIKQTPRPPIEIVPTVSKALNDVIMMAVSKDPAQRFQSADAFRNALSQIDQSPAQASNQQTTAATGAFVGRNPTPVAAKPAFDPGFTVPEKIDPASRTNRNLLLVVGSRIGRRSIGRSRDVQIATARSCRRWLQPLRYKHLRLQETSRIRISRRRKFRHRRLRPIRSLRKARLRLRSSRRLWRGKHELKAKT